MKIRKWKLTDTVLTVLCMAGILVALTACSSTDVLPATQAYAQRVAEDNAKAAAEGNPFSGILSALGTLVASLAGAGVLIRRYDAKPYEADDGRKVTEDELAKVALAARESDKPTPPTSG